MIDLAVMLYDGGQISLGRAAEVAGLGHSELIDELGRRDIATVRRSLAIWSASLPPFIASEAENP